MFTFFSSLDFISIVINIVAYLMALCIAMSFHEFAHAFAASTQGDYTAKVMGRQTLAPLAHVDVLGFVSFLFFRFGWAKPVPVDPRNFKNGKKSNFLVAIAGIVTNLILGTAFLFIYMLIEKLLPGFYSSGLYGSLLGQFLNISVVLNFSLAFFNLLPINPLDGFKIVETFSRFDNKFVEFMKRYSNIVYIIFIVSNLYAIYFNLTAGTIIELLIKLFSKILKLGV